MKKQQLPPALLTLAALLLATPLLSPAANAPDVPVAPASAPSVDLSTPAKSVQAFVAAVEAANVADAQHCVVDDPAQQSVVQQIVASLKTLRDFKAAAKNLFPADSAEDLRSMPDPGPGKQIKDGLSELISADNTTATVSRSDANLSDFKPMSLKKVGNDWKIDFSATADGQATLQQLPKIAPLLKRFDDVTQNLIAGNYKTWAQVQDALQQASTTSAPSQ